MTNLEIIQQLNELSFQINTLMAAALGSDELKFNISKPNSNSNEITADNIGDFSEVDNFFLATELKGESSIENNQKFEEGEELDVEETNNDKFFVEGEELM
jgi:hypothetical protein